MPKPFFKNYRQVAFVGLAFFLGIFLVLGLVSWFMNEGHFVYFLDDTYIHLATARQLADKGVWGVANGDFVFCSSSPHYTVLLSLLTGIIPWTYWPVLINLVAGVGCVLLVVKWLRDSEVSPSRAWIWLALWVVLVPLPFLALIGMEHTLQVWIDLAFAWALVQALTRTESQRLLQLGLLAALVTGIRYEGMFLVAAGCVLGVWKKKGSETAAMLIGGAATVVGYGLFSQSQGGTFFPTSLLIKGSVPGSSLESLMAMVLNLLTYLHEESFVASILVLMAVGLVLPWVRNKEPELSKGWYLLALTMLAFPLHLLASKVGGVRYEAYLMALGFLALILSAEQWGLIFKWKGQPFSVRIILLFGVAWVLIPFGMRAGFFSWNLPRGSNNIYSQQIQMSRFVERYYPKSSIAANDIGALTYFSNIQLTDMVALGDQEMLPLILNRQNTPGNVQALAESREVEIAVIYDSWVSAWTPATWVPVATWALPDNFICGDSIVTWYGADSLQAHSLSLHLHEFEKELPAKVNVRYLK